MKALLNIIAVLCISSAFAQKVEISNPYKLPNRTSKFRVIGKNNDGIIVRMYGTQDVIDVFDDNLRLTATRTIDFKNQSGLLQYIMLNKTGAVLFYLSQDKKFAVLMAQPVNSKFVEIGKPLVVDTIYDRRDLVSANLRYRASVDQSYLMIYYPYFSGGNIESIKFICVDRSVHALYNKKVSVNRSEKDLEESKAILDNNGNSYLVLKPSSPAEGTHYDVLRMSSGGDFSFFSIITQKAVFGEPYFEVDNKNENFIMCALNNEDKQSEEVANGFSYSSYSLATGSLLNTRYTPFSKEFITELTGRVSNADKGKLYTFTIRKAQLRNDGGALIIAESYIRDSRESAVAIGFQPGLTNYRTTNIYEFNDLISFSVNPGGKLDWYAVMRKKQASEDDNGVYSSYLMMNEKDKLRFLYLDDITTSGVLNQYVLSSTDGKNERSAVLNQEEKEVMLLPKMGKQVTPNELVIPSYMNGSLRLAKITY